MSNLLKRFNKEVVGSQERIYDFLPKITPSGDLKRIREIDVIINSWNVILTTPKRSYLFDPNFGSDLHRLVFEPVDEQTVERIKMETQIPLEIYDNRATIEDIQVLLKPNGKGFTLNIVAEYKGDTKNLTVKFDETIVMEEGLV